MPLQIRRAEPKDAQLIYRLIRDVGGDEMTTILKKRFGETNIAKLIDVAPFSVVGTDSKDTIVGFMALSNGPHLQGSMGLKDTTSSDGESSGNSTITNWDQWLKTRYDCKHLQLHDTKFLSFFVALPDQSREFLHRALASCFTSIPSLENVSYLLTDQSKIFAPLDQGFFEEAELKSPTISSPITENSYRKPQKAGGLIKDGSYFHEIKPLGGGAFHSLYNCTRKFVVPKLRVRRARVEDTDDLMPMLKQRDLLDKKHSDYYVAELLNPTTDDRMTLVAEVDGEVVGFMCLTTALDYRLLSQKYELSAYPSLFGENSEVSEGMVKINSMKLDEESEMLEDPKKAFYITLLCIDDMWASQSFAFIRAAFVMQPERQFGLMSLATTSGDLPVLRCFAKVNAKSGATNTQSLYIVSRRSALETVSVRRGNVNDLPNLQKLIAGEKTAQSIFESFKAPERSGRREKEQHLYIVETGKDTVGLCVIDYSDRFRTYTDQFNVEEYITLSHHDMKHKPCVLKYLNLWPTFEPQSRWVLEEVLRLSGVNTLLFPNDATQTENIVTKTLVQREFVPVKRRRCIQYPNNLRDGEVVPLTLQHNLFMITSNMLYEPKLNVNARIVVLGGSVVGISFLESLVYTSHLNFNNLTLISLEGIPEFQETSPFVSNRCYTAAELSQISLESFINVVKARATSIDRVAKIIKLDNGDSIPYDYLVLTPGLQFHVANHSEALAQLDNVVDLNRSQSDKIEEEINQIAAGAEGKVIVYGRSLQVFATTQHLLDKGVKGSQIAVVIPSWENGITCFNNATIEEKVFDLLKKADVDIYMDTNLSTWSTNNDRVSEITLEMVKPQHTFFTLSASALFYADEKTVHPDSFQAINNACLVFDGRLVIDKYFRTIDPCVFAAGSCTKFKAGYKTSWMHGYYDLREVGKRLATFVLPMFDPFAIPETIVDDNQVLKFEASKKCEAWLPGGYYLHFDVPRLPVSKLETRRESPDYGRDLIIDNAKSGYFRIHVNKDGYIVSLTYFGPQSIPTDNYLCLYKLHEKYLNRLIARFDEGIIEDFVDFLAQPWALLLYHDHFRHFLQTQRAELLALKSVENREIVEKIKKAVDSGEKPTQEEMAAAQAKFAMSMDRQALQRKVLGLLQYAEIYSSYP